MQISGLDTWQVDDVKGSQHLGALNVNVMNELDTMFTTLM